MIGWNFNMAEAPRGETRVEARKIGKNDAHIERHIPAQIIAAGQCGVVTLSYWLPKQDRWSMFSKDAPPIAWMPFPSHPHSEAAE
jgi:hypothetical protein